MKKCEIRPNTLLYPVPALMVSSGTADGRTNIMTAGWTGTICTKPPMAYVSIRPSRVSYEMIKESGEFVLNLNTEKLVAFSSAKTENDVPVRGSRSHLSTERCRSLSSLLIGSVPLLAGYCDDQHGHDKQNDPGFFHDSFHRHCVCLNYSELNACSCI